MVTPLAPGAEAACIERDPGAVAAPWAALAAQRAEPTIFLTPEWLAVARAHDASAAITVTVGDPPCGIAALAQGDDGTLRFAGGELTDVQDVVAPRGLEVMVASAIGEWLASRGAPRVELSYVPEETPTLAAIAAALGSAGYAVTRERQVAAPHLPLPDDFATYVASLGKKERHELRRKIRRLERSAAASFRTATPSERDPALDRFFALHRLSRGRKATFMTPLRERFFRDVVDALAPLDRLRLGVLRVDGTDAAVLLAFAYEGKIELYNAAYDPGLSRLSVGIVSHAWAIREAIAEGIRRYDFLRGDEPYKYDLGGRDRWLARLVAVRP